MSDQLFPLGMYTLNVVIVFASCRRRSRSASSSGSSSSGSHSPKKAMKRISNTPPRKQVHHPDTSISPAGKDRRSPSPRARRSRGSASPARSSGMIFMILLFLSLITVPHTDDHKTLPALWLGLCLTIQIYIMKGSLYSFLTDDIENEMCAWLGPSCYEKLC